MNLEIEKDKRKDHRDKDRKIHNIWTLDGIVLSKVRASIFISIFLPNWKDWIFVCWEESFQISSIFSSIHLPIKHTHY